MVNSLIGYTGFVGSNLMKKNEFSNLYNRDNISTLKDIEHDTIICAAPSAVKWWANKNPKEDLKIVTDLMQDLISVKTKHFILISTIDVYSSTAGVDENFNPEPKHPYGLHRYMLEKFVQGTFENYLIIRLPGLFGTGLKKNVIYDLIHNNSVENINTKNIFQWYNIERLSDDIKIAIKNNLKIVNLFTEPIETTEICNFFNYNFQDSKNQISYNGLTKYGKHFNSKSDWIQSKSEVLEEIKKFIDNEKINL
jgi:nucleoside-diphosphate-sugar epimerase